MPVSGDVSGAGSLLLLCEGPCTARRKTGRVGLPPADWEAAPAAFQGRFRFRFGRRRVVSLKWHISERRLGDKVIGDQVFWHSVFRLASCGFI